MPRQSKRQKLILEIDDMLKTLAMFFQDDTDEFQELLEIKAHLESYRFMSCQDAIEKNLTMRNMLWRFTERYFDFSLNKYNLIIFIINLDELFDANK
jgi:hypothetical protein